MNKKLKVQQILNTDTKRHVITCYIRLQFAIVQAVNCNRNKALENK